MRSEFRGICLQGVRYPINTDAERDAAMAAMVAVGKVFEPILGWSSKTEYDADLKPSNTGWLLRSFVP